MTVSIPIEVLCVTSARVPNQAQLHELWKKRSGRRPAPLLLIVFCNKTASICGVNVVNLGVYHNLSIEFARNLATALLKFSDIYDATSFAERYMHSLDKNYSIPGILNNGFASSYELYENVPKYKSWSKAKKLAHQCRDKANLDLISSLGFTLPHSPPPPSNILKHNDNEFLVLSMLEKEESFDDHSPRFDGQSASSHLISIATDKKIPWAMLLKDSLIRLYSVNRVTDTSNYIECHAQLLDEANYGYLWTLFSADALADKGSMCELIKNSTRFTENITKELRKKVYEEIVPNLAMSIFSTREIKKPSATDLKLTYEMALTVLFRLLFIAYAEDNNLIPTYAHEEGIYSIKKTTEQLITDDIHPRKENGTELWDLFMTISMSIYEGNDEIDIPEYGGEMFSSNVEISEVGSELAKIQLSNELFAQVLIGLLTVVTDDNRGPVDFRSLGVEEFGKIYEGLLESELMVADMDLRKEKGKVVPATNKTDATIRKGQVYVSTKSGERKISGSYYTKPVIVKQMLKEKLMPALSSHFDRLDSLDDVEAAQRLFQFSVADISMGSGHFLIAALDVIGEAMNDYLEKRQLSEIIAELNMMRNAAIDNIGKTTSIDQKSLVKRCVAMKCIYGVDINTIAVQLTRLAIWVRTFIPGIPLSLLEYRLVQGNSLLGIGTVDELDDGLSVKFGERNFFNESYEEMRKSVLSDIFTLSNQSTEIVEHSIEKTEEKRELQEKLKKKLVGLKAISDIYFLSLSKQILLEEQYQSILDNNMVLFDEHRIKINNELQNDKPFHFPVMFPEIFLKSNPGFDIILGNPPWQEATVEKLQFWTRHYPKLKSNNEKEKVRLVKLYEIERPDLKKQYEKELNEMNRLRSFLTMGNYEGMDVGDPDLYKAFCWRFISLCSETGSVSVVLPRSAVSALGSSKFRRKLLSSCREICATILTNNGKWVFEEVHAQYSICLLSFTKKINEDVITLKGPIHNENQFRGSDSISWPSFTATELLGWNDSVSFPILPTSRSVDIFRKLKSHPSFDSGKFHWEAIPDSELHATNQKPLMNTEVSDIEDDNWPVYKGESFDMWKNDTEKYYFKPEYKKIYNYLLKRRITSYHKVGGTFSIFTEKIIYDESTLPCLHPRIAFRNTTNRTNTRTIIAALVPPKVFLTNAAPYLLWPRGNEYDQAYLLGLLCSRPLDWYARRFVELSLNFYILNHFPIPKYKKSCMLTERLIYNTAVMACKDSRLIDWQSNVLKYCKTPTSPTPKSDMKYENDALSALLYGLTKEDLIHIYETFHTNWRYEDELAKTLHFYEKYQGGQNV